MENHKVGTNKMYSLLEVLKCVTSAECNKSGHVTIVFLGPISTFFVARNHKLNLLHAKYTACSNWCSNMFTSQNSMYKNKFLEKGVQKSNKN